MICPLFRMAALNAPENVAISSSEQKCIHRECQWWHNLYEDCAVGDIASALNSLERAYMKATGQD